ARRRFRRPSGSAADARRDTDDLLRRQSRGQSARRRRLLSRHRSGGMARRSRAADDGDDQAQGRGREARAIDRIRPGIEVRPMSIDDPFAEPAEIERTIIRPNPGGRQPVEVAPTAPPAMAPAPAPPKPLVLAPLAKLNPLVNAALPLLDL